MTPIIFLSAKGETADKVRAFRSGAEDYVVKPFDAVELVAVQHQQPEIRVDAGYGVLVAADPCGEVIEIGPVVAPAGTTTFSSVVDSYCTTAATPLKPTEFCPPCAPKFIPVMTTWVPCGPERGEKLTIAGVFAGGETMERRLPVRS